jgi:predicted phosphodiesterase
MSSRRPLALLFALLLCGCDWDLTQAAFHPSVEQRVAEGLSGELGTPKPVEVDPDSFRFAMFGDPQVHSDSIHMLDRFSEDIGPRHIDFFCVLGDLTHDATEDEVGFIKQALDAVGIPYYVTVGNHDLYQAEGWDRFKQAFGPATYSVVFARRVRLVFIDTASEVVGPTQFDWLESELLQEPGPYVTLVGTHFPVYDGITPTLYRTGSTAERYKLQHLLQSSGAYALVSGHIHAFRHTVAGGVHHFICGAMAPDKLDYGNRGYLLFTFAHDSLSWEFVEI